MKVLPIFIICSVAAALSTPSADGQTATTDPVGFVTVSAAPGLSGAKRSTYLSLPLLEVDEGLVGAAAGVISSVASNSIVVTNAGWSPGSLSQPSAPFIIQITSGAAAGRMFLVASSATTGGASGGAALANTATNLFISPIDGAQITNNLPAVGVSAGDNFRLFACDTLSSAFGTPGSSPGSTNSVLGGTNAVSADNVVVTVNGTPTTYYFNTTSSTWVRSPINTLAENVALVPNYGVTFNRLSTNSFSRVLTGQVPVTSRVAAIKNSGSTVLAQYWPTTNTLVGLGIQNIPGWVSGTNQASTDNVILTINGTPNTYYYNGTNWLRFPLPQNANNTAIPVGAAVTVVKKGSAVGYSSLAQQVPYSLE